METLDEIHQFLSVVVSVSLDDRILGALTDGGGAQDALKTENPSRAVYLRKVREVPAPVPEKGLIIVPANGRETNHALHLLAGDLDLVDFDLLLDDFVLDDLALVLLDLVLTDLVFFD